nr:hypothetical protein [Gammaproteobacteria bacterium AqS3]
MTDDTVTASIFASGGGYDGISEDITIKALDTDLLVFDRDGYNNIYPWESESFTVRLSVRPFENITVRVYPHINFYSFYKTNSSFDTDAGTPGNQNTLTFTPQNWSVPQTVTVTSGGPYDRPQQGETPVLVFILPSGARETVGVHFVDPKIDRTYLYLSSKVLTIDEGSSQTFTVRPQRAPSSEMTVVLWGNADEGSRSDLLKMDKTSLTFTPSNWHIPQTVTVSALRDSDAKDSDGSVLFSLLGSGIASVRIYIRDNNLGINIPAGTLFVPEGDARTFPVKLNSPPSGTVTVNVSQPSNPDMTVDTDPPTTGNQTSLTFTAGNWNIPQTVAVTAAEDADAIADRSDSIYLSVPESDTNYAGQTETLSLVIRENDRYPIIEAVANPLVVTEGDSATFTVRLAAEIERERDIWVKFYQPFSLGVTVDTDPRTVGNQTTLRFTSDNWNIRQTVTVNAAEDSDDLLGVASIRLKHTEFSDFIDDEEVFHNVGILVADNDTAGLVLSTTNLGVSEGSSKAFTVALATLPTADVTVMLVQENPENADVTLDRNKLTFTRDSWNIAQTVRVRAAEDDDAIDDRAAISLTPSGGGYDNLNRRVAVTVNEDDKVGLKLSSDSLTIPEGDSDTFKVQLVTQPSENVTVRLRQPENTDVTLDTDTATTGNQNTLTFTSDNWNQPQTVTVSTLQDDDTLDDSASITLTASGGGYKNVTASMPVSVTERSEAGLILSTRSISLDEGGSRRFTV